MQLQQELASHLAGAARTVDLTGLSRYVHMLVKADMVEADELCCQLVSNTNPAASVGCKHVQTNFAICPGDVFVHGLMSIRRTR